MKKLFSFLLAAAAFGAVAHASAPTVAYAQESNLEVATIQAGAPAQELSRADGEYTLQLCGNLASWSRINTSSLRTTVCCVYITPEVATKLAGNSIKTISFSTAYKNKVGAKYTGTIFVSEDMESDPVTSTAITVVTADTSNPVPQTETLEEPYTIKAGQGFYFGYTVKGGNTNFYPIGFDAGPANDFAGYVGVRDASGDMLSWDSAATAIGANLYILAGTEGPVTSLDNFGYIASFSYPTFSLPVYWTGGTLSKPSFQLVNLGDNRITSMEYSITVNGVESERISSAVSVAKHGNIKRTIDAPAIVEGFNTVTFNLYKLNDVDCTSKATAYCVYMNQADAVDRKFVVEKATGTWCQYCPTGIVGFEDMEKLYPETFLGIDLHLSDDFQVNNNELLNYIYEFSQGYVPMAIVNRDMMFVNSPSTAQLKTYYNKWNATKNGFASLTLEAVAEEGSSEITVKATPTFAIDDPTADFALAFVLLENGLQGTQTNGYSGNPSAPGDWGSKPTYVDWVYQHTARSYTNVYGLDNSVPAAVVKGTAYPFQTTIDGAVATDLAKSYVIALLLDRRTGVVVNAARADITNGAGISDVLTSTPEGPVEYFNLQGMPVSDPQPGQLLIRRQAGSATKVVF